MTSGKIYMQPLGILRGCISSEAVDAGRALPLAGGPLAFASVLVLERAGAAAVRRTIIPVTEFDHFLSGFSREKAGYLRDLMERLTSPRPPLRLAGGRVLDWWRPLVQGILNVTPDSFSDGGRHNSVDDALVHARQMMAQGADIIDIGGESTRPGAETVSLEEELHRVLPVIEKLRHTEAIISLDTRNALVMRAGLVAGVHIINDVSALSHDPDSLTVMRESEAPIILMHAQGTPQTMQKDPVYDNVVLDVYDYLEQRIGFWCAERHRPRAADCRSRHRLRQNRGS